MRTLLAPDPPSLTKLNARNSPKLLSSSMTWSSVRYDGRPPIKILLTVSGTFVETTPGTCGAISFGSPPM